jgi:uncharacterized repeat protein (TIGR02543 family)
MKKIYFFIAAVLFLFFGFSSELCGANYNIDFDANTGSGTMATQVIATGVTAAITTNSFTKTGYVFDGWNTAADGTGTLYLDAENYTMGSSSLLLYAQWTLPVALALETGGTLNTYNNILYLNTLPAANQTVGMVGNGTIGASNLLTDPSFTASSDYLLLTGSAAINAGTNAYNSLGMDVKGGRRIDNVVDKGAFEFGYSLEFDANTGAGTMAAQLIATGVTAAITTNSFTKTGYVFDGWNTAADGTGTLYLDAESYTMGSSSLLLYAQWTLPVALALETGGTLNTYNNILYLNTLPAANQTVGMVGNGTIGASNLLTDPSFTASSDYLLLTGSAAINAGTNAYNSLGMDVKGGRRIDNVVDKGAFEFGYSLEFDANTGAGTMAAQLIATGVTAAITTNSFTKTGYVFDGWNTAADGTGTLYMDAENYTMGSSSLLLYAQWTLPVALALETGGTLNTYNNILYLNTLPAANQTVGMVGNGTIGASNLLTDPSFTASSDYLLLTGSAAINAGTNAYNSLLTDIKGGGRLVTTMDAGAFEFGNCVNFDANTGSGTMAPQTITVGGSAALNTNSFTKGGTVFSGWNTVADGTGTAYAEGASYAIASNSTYYLLYAQWVNTWTGGSSTDWNTAANWGLGTVPTSSIDVVIPNVSNKPLASSASVCKNMTINAGGVMTIPVNKLLTVSGSITNNGGAAGLVINAGAGLVNGSLIFHNEQNAPVSATVELYSLAFRDAVRSNNKWQYIAVPLRQVVASPTLDGAVIRRWDEPSCRWVSQNNLSELTSFTGFEITQSAPAYYSFQGYLENNSLTNLQLTYNGAVPADAGWNLIGNSYTGAININQITFGTQTEATVYLFNTGSPAEWSAAGGATGVGAGQYTAVPKNTVEPTLPTQISSLQSFFVKANSASALATISIPYSAVGTVEKNTSLMRANAAPQVCTRIDVQGTSFSDRMWLFTNPDCTHTFDNGWDGFKSFGTALAPQLFAMEPDGSYQVSTTEDINNTDLGFQAGTDSNYTLSFTHQSLESRYESLFLIDLSTNTTTDITQSGTQYSFTATTTPAPVKRFKIVTSPGITTQTGNKLPGGLEIFSAQDLLFVNNPTAEKGNLTVYDMSGRVVMQSAFMPFCSVTLPTHLGKGGYLLKAKTAERELIHKFIITK